jgi:hypothetical protein
MYPGRFEDKLIVAVVGAVVVGIALVAEWWERRTEDPIMKRRINAGSDRFLRRRGSIWHAATRETRNAFNLPEFRNDD